MALVWAAAFPALSEGGSAANDTLAEARRLIDAGDAAEAESLLRALTIARPRAVEPRLALADALRAQDRGAEARSVLLRLAERLMAEEQLADAVRLLEKARAVSPDPEVATLLGQALFLAGDYEGSERALAAVVEARLGGWTAEFYLGSALWENGNIPGADELLRRAAAGATDPRAAYQLGRFLAWRGEFEGAIVVLEPLRPDLHGSLDWTLELARAYEGAGRWSEAESAYRGAIALAADYSQPYYGLAQVLGRLGRREEAAQELERYRALYEKEKAGTRQQGLIDATIDEASSLLNAGRQQQAVELLDSLDGSSDALGLLATCYRQLGDSAAAIAALERALVVDPGRSDLRARLQEMRLTAIEDGP